MQALAVRFFFLFLITLFLSSVLRISNSSQLFIFTFIEDIIFVFQLGSVIGVNGQDGGGIGFFRMGLAVTLVP